MKNILVAFDFSKNSMHALEYAIMFANVLETGISLVWVDDSVSEETVYQTIDHDIRIEMKNSIKQIEDEFNPKLKYGKINLILSKGKVYREIHNIAVKHDADFVFAGTHGVSGFEQYWIGSNAYRIVSSSPCPVVTIRSNYKFRDGIKNMLIPIDSSMETKQKLPFAVKLADKMGAKIHMLEIYNTPLKVIRKRIDKIADEAREYAVKHKIEFDFETIEGSNVVRTILNHVDKKDIDLICIMTDQGTTTANKFLGPYAQQLINNSPVPIISLRAKEF
jgi:nucleotide-binding universal stress UspA family protein